MNKEKFDFGYRTSFDTRLATFVGINAAIVHEKIAYFITENKKSGRNEIDGHFWYYATYRELSDRIGILTEKQVRTAVDALVRSGYLKVGYFSYGNVNRTPWYTIEDETMLMIYPQKSSAPTGDRSAPEGRCSAPQGRTINSSNSHSNTIEEKEKEKKINKEKERPFTKDEWTELSGEFPKGYHASVANVLTLRELVDQYGFKVVVLMLDEVRHCCGVDDMDDYIDTVKKRLHNPPHLSFWYNNNRQS